MRQLIVTIVIALVAIFYIMTIREGHNWGDDFSMYIHHAKNIVEGNNYADIGYVYNKYCIIAPKTYPPIFPILLTPFYKVFGLSITAFKIEIIIFFILSLFIFFLSFKNEIKYMHLVLLIAIIGFNPFLWSFKDNVVSDIPFLFFTYISLYLISQFHKSENLPKQLIYGITTGITIAISYETRTIGFVLIPSILLYDFINYRWATKFSIITTITFILLATFTRIFFHNESSYLDQIDLSPEYIVFNIVGYTKSLAYVWNSFGKNLKGIILTGAMFIVFNLLCVRGYIKKIKEGVTIYEIFPIFYMAVIMLAPSTEGTRYLIPIIPLYIFYGFLGLEKLKYEKYILYMLIILTLVIYIIAYSKMNYGAIPPIGKKETTELFRYIKENTNESDIIIFGKPRLLSLYTNRKSSVYYKPKDDKYLWRYFNDIGARYIILAPDGFDKDDYMPKFINKYTQYFEEVYTNSDFIVYRIKTWPFWVRDKRWAVDKENCIKMP